MFNIIFNSLLSKINLPLSTELSQNSILLNDYFPRDYLNNLLRLSHSTNCLKNLIMTVLKYARINIQNKKRKKDT